MSEKPTLFEKSLPYIMVVVLVPIMFAMGLGAGYWLWGRQAEGSQTAQQTPSSATQQALQPTQTKQTVYRYNVSEDDDPATGPEDAPITIIEFSDYQCPYCQSWHNDVFQRLMDEYPDQIRFIYRDFPLYSIHPEALPAAEAAECANEQGTFWEYHDALFSMRYSLGNDAYYKYADELGLDIDAFTECMEEHRYQDEIIADAEYAPTVGVRATPTFFVNGIFIEGALPFESFQQLINMELAGELE